MDPADPLQESGCLAVRGFLCSPAKGLLWGKAHLVVQCLKNTADSNGSFHNFGDRQQLRGFRGSYVACKSIAPGDKTQDFGGCLFLLHTFPSHSPRFRLFLSKATNCRFTGAITIPDIVREGSDFVQRLQNENIWTVVLEKMRSGLGYVFDSTYSGRSH